MMVSGMIIKKETGMKSKIILNNDFKIGTVDPRIYGGFIEHLGRAVYEGIYEPGHPQADGDGFRGDVLELVRELDMPITRYPGGNFVSGYNWEDGVGPRETRPSRLDLAWKALEPNSFGTNEFVDWCKKARTAPMMAVNLGTRGPAEAQALVEYCNHPGGTHWSELRRSHGWQKPHDIKVWCLGNEMDGPWQTGHKTAVEYGRIAAETAKMMKWTDPSIELVACGSSGPGMPGFGQWEATVLEHTYDLVDYVSIHRYYGNQDEQTPGFLSMSDEMDSFIKNTVAACDFARAKLKKKKRIMLSFDEWNVWFHSHGSNAKSPDWSLARPILEDVYTMEDALLVGSMLITLMNNADRVKIACLAQTVNVIAPIMTRKGGGAWRQTIFHPFSLSSANGRGSVLRQVVESPAYEANFGFMTDGRPEKLEGVPFLTSAAVINPKTGETVIFAVNRSLDKELELTVELQNMEETRVLDWSVLHHANLKAVNTELMEEVKPREATGAILKSGRLSLSLPPASWNMLRLGV